MVALKVVHEVLFFADCLALMGIVLLQMCEESGMGGAFG